MFGWFRRTGQEVLGWTLIVVGAVLLVLPGPGTLLMLGGVALLAPHYTWARRAMHHLHDAAIEAGHKSVQSKRAIATSALSAAALMAVGVVWMLEPSIPQYAVWKFEIGPGLPGGRAAGVGLFASGLIAAAALGYSLLRWHPTASSQEK